MRFLTNSVLSVAALALLFTTTGVLAQSDGAERSERAEARRSAPAEREELSPTQRRMQEFRQRRIEGSRASEADLERRRSDHRRRAERIAPGVRHGAPMRRHLQRGMPARLRELDLTPGQRLRIAEIMAEQRERISEVLTDEQRAKLHADRGRRHEGAGDARRLRMHRMQRLHLQRPHLGPRGMQRGQRPDRPTDDAESHDGRAERKGSDRRRQQRRE
ncbi:MAG: hypothetical protein WD294_06400 [Phycisphaeraceae bacterium]